MTAKFRDHFFYQSKTLSDVDTLLIDLNLVEMLSYIAIEINATNYNAVKPDIDLAQYITSIELVDGSEVLESLSMQEWAALNFYESGVMPPNLLTEAASGANSQTVFMHFGRFKDDLNFFLNPTLYRNPQLKINVNFSAVGTGNFLSGSVTATVKARCITEGHGDYQGYMSAKEIYSFTAGTSGDELINLPRDYPYRNMLIKALLTENVPSAVLSNVKLSCDSGKFVFSDILTTDLIEQNRAQYGMCEQIQVCDGSVDNDFLSYIYDAKVASVGQVASDYIAAINDITAEKIGFSTYNLTTPADPSDGATGTSCALHVKGNCPYGMFNIPFGSPVDNDAWFDPTLYGNVELKLTQAAAGACAVVVQQLRR